jgi:hypothetical protein
MTPMTEVEWLACADPRTILNRLRKPSSRKLRLFAVACCRSVWVLLKDERGQRSVEAAEKWADGLLGKSELSRFQAEAELAQNEWTTAVPGRGFDATSDALVAASSVALPAKAWVKTVANSVRNALHHAEGRLGLLRAENLQCSYLRCIFGNPLRPVVANSAWLTPTVTSLAQATYDDRAFDRMPILADALEDAGCTNQDILNHCRQPGEHVRGCWVVDLLTGME